MLSIKVVLHHMLLVVNLIVFHACCDRMILVLHANRKDSRLRVPSIVTSKQLVVEPRREGKCLELLGKESTTIGRNPR